MRIVSERLGHVDPAITLRLYVHPDSKMHKAVGMRQNKRVAAAMAKAEQDSQSVRTDAKRLQVVVG